jgi:hypothetical protein
MTDAPQAPSSPPPLAPSPIPTPPGTPPHGIPVPTSGGVDLLPAPPRGPGVKVPFAAPPRDIDKTRTVVTIVLSAVVAIVLCGGVLVGTVSVLVWSSNEMTTRAFRTANAFMSDIVDKNYKHAYKSMCSAARHETGADEFGAAWERQDITRFHLSSQMHNGANGNLVVPTEVVSLGREKVIDLTLKVDPQTMNMAVCGY